jgi:malonyl-CoA/methylmalonyl-CoA synthetase
MLRYDIGPHVTLDEALHFVTTCRAHAVIHAPAFKNLADQLSGQTHVPKEYRPIQLNFQSEANKMLDPRQMRFSMRKIRDLNKPGALIFTSGSTGKPKGATMRRYNIGIHSLMQIWKNDLRPGDTVLQMLPIHHATGLVLNTIPTLIAGGCVEFTPLKFDAATIWERIRLGNIKSISAVPTIYVRLLQHWEDTLQHLDVQQREGYSNAVKAIQQFHVGTSSLPTPVSKKWAELFGRRIFERYGGTEFGNPYANHATTELVPVSRGLISSLHRDPDVLINANIMLGICWNQKSWCRVVSRQW